MKKACIGSALIVAWGMIVAATAWAQNPGFGAAPPPAAAAPVGSEVAIIDLSYIFKNYWRFKALTEDMRASVLRAEEDLKARRTEIETLAKRLQDLEGTLRKDSPEYKQLDADITKRKIDLNAMIALQKKDFLEREAKIYFSCYQEVLDAVKYHADQRRITLVLRFNGDPVSDSDPQEILKQLNKSVVYYNQGIDITPIILADLNRSQPTPAPGQPGGGTVIRPGPPGVPTRPGIR